jgi:cullin 3
VFPPFLLQQEIFFSTSQSGFLLVDRLTHSTPYFILLERPSKLIMAPLQGLTNHDTVDFDVTWGVLEGALREIHTKNASRLSFEELYRNAYKLVLKKKGEELYNRVSGLEEELLRENVRSQVAQMVTPPLILGATGEQVGGQGHQRRADGERFLRVLKDSYADHQLCMNMITDVLMYMVSLILFPIDLLR